MHKNICVYMIITPTTHSNVPAQSSLSFTHELAHRSVYTHTHPQSLSPSETFLTCVRWDPPFISLLSVKTFPLRLATLLNACRQSIFNNANRHTARRKGRGGGREGRRREEKRQLKMKGEEGKVMVLRGIVFVKCHYIFFFCVCWYSHHF